MVQTRQTWTDNSPLRWCAQGEAGRPSCPSTAAPAGTWRFGTPSRPDVLRWRPLCPLLWLKLWTQTDRQTDRQLCGWDRSSFTTTTQSMLSLSLPVCLTLVSLADTYWVAVAFSVCCCLQVQAVDAVCVHVVRQQHALIPGDVRATLPERRPVTNQLFNFVHLRERQAERQTGYCHTWPEV